jgi:hypothetical protein
VGVLPMDDLLSRARSEQEGGWLLDATGIVSRRRWTDLAKASTEAVRVE